ncbi:uncharacterized protein isoform X2 [Leptinotarsa decemlineata]|uniref:uncharacterized protein isoform X2 n=1 Tax=Leptinotarsa decemlineata TaxID=7539 RepID=UPI003D304BCD
MTADDCVRKIKKELESVGDEVVFETNIMKCETGETEIVGESEEYDMFGIEMVTHNLEEKYDIYHIKKEGVIDVYHKPKSEKCIEEIGEGPQNKFLDIQGEDMIHDSKPTTEWNVACLSKFISCIPIRIFYQKIWVLSVTNKGKGSTKTY